MNFRITAIFMVLSLLTFSACCGSKTAATKKSRIENAQEADTLHKQSSGSKTVIQENSSVITGEILEVKPAGGNDFTLKVLVKEAEDDQAFESLAVKGETYQMEPAFTMTDKEIKPVEKNRKLMELKSLAPGTTFRARVSLTQYNKWIIREVLDANKPDNK
ncbi:MAG: hypothetical protein ACM3QX_08610 [Syntrophomonadaceae bacterium]